MNHSPNGFASAHCPQFRDVRDVRGRGVRGFTIIEMLVVISILGLLVGLLMPALSSARSRGQKTDELNKLRQFHLAWTMYAGQNDDKALPGYIDEATQTQWNVAYRFPDGNTIPSSQAAPYPWRLLSYLDYSVEFVLGHLDKENADIIADAQEVAYNPMFGYNAVYVGGWYDTALTGQTDPTESYRPLYSSSKCISLNASQAAEPSRLVLFCSSSVLPVGTYHKWIRTTPGSHYVLPPTVAGTQRWTSGGGPPDAAFGMSGSVSQLGSGGGQSSAQVGTGDTSVVQVLDQTTLPKTSVPIGRYTGHVAVGWADGSTSTETPGALAFDQRLWIPRANSPTFTHAP